VPGLPGDDRIKCPAGGVPGFERRHLDPDPALPGQAGHPDGGVDPEHSAAGRLELPGCDAGAAADGQRAGAAAGGDDPLYQCCGTAGASLVAAFRVRAERLCHLPVLMRLVR